jgi:hypothetical protein
MSEFVHLYETQIFAGVLAVAALVGLILLFSELRGGMRNRKKWKKESGSVKSRRGQYRRNAS